MSDADTDRPERPVPDGQLDLAPQAARNVLGTYIGGWSAKQVAEHPADALRVAIQKLPAAGKIRGKSKVIVKAMTWVLGEVPTDDEGREVIATAVDDLVKRAYG